MSKYGKINHTDGVPKMSGKERSILAAIWGSSVFVAVAVLFYAQVAIGGSHMMARTPADVNTVAAQQQDVKVEAVETEGATIIRERVSEPVLLDGNEMTDDDVMFSAPPDGVQK